MGPNALRGLGLGIAAAGETIGRGMSEDIRAKREAEREAAREASLERRWAKELAVRTEERKQDREFQASERAADRTAQSAERAADRAQQDKAEKGRNSRLDKQLNLQERYQLTKELSDVQQQVDGRLAKLNSQYADRYESIRLEKTGDDLLKAEAALQKEYDQAFMQVRELGNTQKKQVLNAYGDLGKSVAETAEFLSGDIEALKIGLGVTDPKTGDDTKTPPPDDGTTRTVKDPNSTSGLFSDSFNFGRAVAEGGMFSDQSVNAFGQRQSKLDSQDIAPAKRLVAEGADLAGRVVGGAEKLGRQFYGGLFLNEQEQEEMRQRTAQRVTPYLTGRPQK